MRSIWSSPMINTNTKIWLFNATCAVCRHLRQRNMEDNIKNSQETGRLSAEVLTSCNVLGPQHKRVDPTEIKKTS